VKNKKIRVALVVRGYRGLPKLTKQSAFAEASVFAKATTDKTADKSALEIFSGFCETHIGTLPSRICLWGYLRKQRGISKTG
jgi:hypothetical protein